jgi:hypothetical protein
MVDVAQLVRVSDCGSEGRGFEPHLPPYKVLGVPGVLQVLGVVALNKLYFLWKNPY